MYATSDRVSTPNGGAHVGALRSVRLSSARSLTLTLAATAGVPSDAMTTSENDRRSRSRLACQIGS